MPVCHFIHALYLLALLICWHQNLQFLPFLFHQEVYYLILYLCEVCVFYEYSQDLQLFIWKLLSRHLHLIFSFFLHNSIDLLPHIAPSPESYVFWFQKSHKAIQRFCASIVIKFQLHALLWAFIFRHSWILYLCFSEQLIFWKVCAFLMLPFQKRLFQAFFPLCSKNTLFLEHHFSKQMIFLSNPLYLKFP